MSTLPAGGAAARELADTLQATFHDIDPRISRRPDPLALVIFGASGDLANRKILPALAKLAERGSLPDAFSIVGVARSDMSDEEFRERCLAAAEGTGAEKWSELAQGFRYVAGDYSEDATFDRLATVLAEVDVDRGTSGNRVYYLATVPSMFAVVARGLAAHKGNEPASGGSFARLVVEKPFGTDLDSAHQLDRELHESFREEQIFRIDHYMGKETVQNVLALRFANAIFEPIWNRRYVDHVQVTVGESLGVEHRGNFYESAGALRDIVAEPRHAGALAHLDGTARLDGRERDPRREGQAAPRRRHPRRRRGGRPRRAGPVRARRDRRRGGPRLPRGGGRRPGVARPRPTWR